MTIKRLEQYRDRKRELAYLKDRVAGLSNRAATQRVSDTVKASFLDFPYTEHTVTVRGYSDKCADSLNRAIRTLERRRAAHAKELAAIEEWLDSVEDSKTRLLIQMYYLDGRTWKAAAQEAYGHPCEDAARMRVKRFVEENF